MRHVFTSEELKMLEKFKAEARLRKKKLKEDTYLDPKTAKRQIDPLKQLEAYRASKQGLDEAKPFGIEKNETIRVMSCMGEK